MIFAARPPPLRPFTRSEFAADRAVHLLGIAGATVAVAVLLTLTASGGGVARIVAAAAYSAGLLTMLGFSAAYSLAVGSPHRELLRRFDHAAIFVMIAGTYTPFTVLGLVGGWAVGMTILVWAIAAIGVALKMTLPQRRFEGVSIALYLAFGWVGLIAIGPLVAALGPLALILLGIGGLVYSMGVIFHVWGQLPYQNAIWHAFVLTAAAVHYAAVCIVIFAGA